MFIREKTMLISIFWIGVPHFQTQESCWFSGGEWIANGHSPGKFPSPKSPRGHMLTWKTRPVAMEVTRCCPSDAALEPNFSSVNQVKQFTDRSKMDRWSKARLSNYGSATTAQQPTLLLLQQPRLSNHGLATNPILASATSAQQPRLSNQPYSRFSNHGSATTGDRYDWKSYFII